MPGEHETQRGDGASPENREGGGPLGIVIRGRGDGLPRARVRAYLWAQTPEPPVVIGQPEAGGVPST